MTAFNQDEALANWTAAAQASQQAMGGSGDPNQGGSLGASSAGSDPSVAPGIGLNDPYDPNSTNQNTQGNQTMASGTAPNLIPARTPNNPMQSMGGSGAISRLPTQDPGSGGQPANLGVASQAPQQSGGALQGGGAAPQAPQNPNPQGDPGLPTAQGSSSGLGNNDPSNMMEPGHQEAMSKVMNSHKDELERSGRADELAPMVNSEIQDQSKGLEDLHSVYANTKRLALQDEGNKAALREQYAQASIPAMTLKDKAMYVIDAFQRAAIASGQGMPPGSAMAYGAQGAQDAVNKKNAGLHDASIAQSRQYDADAEKQADKAVDLAKDNNMGYLKYLTEKNAANKNATDQQKADAADRREQATDSQTSGKIALTAAETKRANAEADAAKAKGAADVKGMVPFTKDDGTTGVIDTSTNPPQFRATVDSKDGAPVTGKKTGTQGSGTAEKDAANAAQLFSKLQASADARQKSGLNLHPKDTTQEVLETMRTQFPKQYDIMRDNPPGTTKAAAAKPSAQAPGPKGTTPAQQAVVDKQVAEDAAAQPAAKRPWQTN